MQAFKDKFPRSICFVFLWIVASVGLSAQPTPQVEGNVLVSEIDPAIAIKVDQSFTYLGRHPINIRNVAAGERLVFAELNGARANRLFILQFEGFLPGIDNEYRYNLSDSPIVAGYPFRSNAYAFDFAKSAVESPGLESAATAKFLFEKGIKAPKLQMMWRSLTVTSADKRNELILFYLEDLSSYNMTLDEVYDPVTGNATPAWTALQPALEKRANESFRLTALDKNNYPLANHWQRIPLRLSHRTD